MKFLSPNSRVCSAHRRGDSEGLRYEKVILATNADVDGRHIRNLTITYFFRVFPQLDHSLLDDAPWS